MLPSGCHFQETQLYCDLFVDAILSGIEKRLGGAAGKKVESDMKADAADELEEEIKEKELRQNLNSFSLFSKNWAVSIPFSVNFILLYFLVITYSSIIYK